MIKKRLTQSACQILGKDLHALWLLAGSINDADKSSLIFDKQPFERNLGKQDLANLYKLGKSLGIFHQTGEQWVLTEDGSDFARCHHWRLWEPSKQAKCFIQEKGASHFFINKYRYANRPLVIDLFAGVGGLSLGFTAAGFNVVLAIDDDQQACEAHQKNFPETLVIQDDINEFAKNPLAYLESNAEQLKDLKISGIIGGPPCQGFSYIGERNTGDERNLLTTKFMDIVLTIAPDFFVMENVPGLTTSGILPKFSTYLQRFAKVNGNPVLRILERLPAVPKNIAKRDKQFKKRIASDVIATAAKTIAQENSIEDEIIAQNIISMSDQLKEAFVDKTINIYPEDIVLSTLEECDIEIFILATALTYKYLIANQTIKAKDTKSHLRQLQTVFFGKMTESKKPCAAAISQICDNYDNAPKSGVFKGVKVGPVLLNLLKKAEQLYDIPAPEILNAASYGTPQDRERVFIVGIKKGLGKEFKYPESTHSLSNNDTKQQPPTVDDALHDLPNIDTIPELIEGHEFSVTHLSEARNEFARAMRYEVIAENDLSLPRISWNPYLVDCCNQTRHEEHVRQRLMELKPGMQDVISRRRKLHPQKVSPTLRAGTKKTKGSHTAVRPIHYKYHRVISVREGARLMGYPDWMIFHKAKWHGFRLIGNGVPFPLANAIATQIFDLLYE